MLVKKCAYCGSKNVVKYGRRRIKETTINRYLCKGCGKTFSERKLKYKTYKPRIILSAITTFNLGYTLGETNKLINRRFGLKIPQSTLHSWIKSYEDVCTFKKIRKRFRDGINPKDLIKSRKLKHRQVYNFSYHTLKLNLLTKKFPSLRRYIQQVSQRCPDFLFKNEGPRCSSFSFKNPKVRRNNRENNALKLAKLGSLLGKTKSARHRVIEWFMLINDSATIATEIPVFLYPSELKKFSLLPDAKNPLTGHIDILQIRWNRIHILDYKPLANKEKEAAQQIFLYSLALAKRTGINLKYFVCAYFDDKNYFEFNPLDVAVK